MKKASSAKEYRWVYILLMMTVTGWGLSWPAGSVVAHAIPPLFAAFVRYTIALPFFIFAAIILERNKPKSYNIKSIKLHTQFAILGALQVTLYNLFFLTGLQYTSSSDATLIIATNPTLTAIFASIYHKDEKISLNKLTGLGTALVGVVIIVFLSPNIEVENRILGDAIILFAAISWATFSTLSRPVLRKVNSPMRLTAWITLYGWIFLLISTLIVNPDQFSLNVVYQIEPLVIYALIFLALIAAVFGNIAWNTSVQLIGSSKTAIFVNFVPIFGVLFSVFLLGDQFSYYYIISLLLIIFGVYNVNKSSR